MLPNCTNFELVRDVLMQRPSCLGYTLFVKGIFKRIIETVCMWLSGRYWEWTAQSTDVWSRLRFTDIHQRSQTFYLPRVMASSAMELNLGIFRFLLTTQVKTDIKLMRPQSLCVMRRFMRVLSSRSDCIRCSDIHTWRTKIFWLWVKTQRPQFEPHARIKMAQVLRSLVYVCDKGVKLLCRSTECATLFKIYPLPVEELFSNLPYRGCIDFKRKSLFQRMWSSFSWHW